MDNLQNFHRSHYCGDLRLADAGKTVAQLLGEVETKVSRTLVLEPGAYPPALVLANFREKDPALQQDQHGAVPYLHPHHHHPRYGHLLCGYHAGAEW